MNSSIMRITFISTKLFNNLYFCSKVVLIALQISGTLGILNAHLKFFCFDEDILLIEISLLIEIFCIAL